MVEKNQIIQAIRELNPTANGEWLEAFRLDALIRYLHHLRYAQLPRAAGGRWQRDPSMPPVVARHSAA